MTRRTMFALGAALTGTLLAGAGALVFAGHGGRAGHPIMKRVVAAVIDDALDAARVTPGQRAVIHAARDRVLAAFEQHGQGRAARIQEALALFESEALDQSRVDALRRSTEEEHQKIADAVSQAVAEAHQALTPTQRKLLADYVRQHRRHAVN